MGEPNVRGYYREIANWITETGLDHTTNGSYYSYFEEIAKVFYVSVDWVKQHAEDIEACFDWDIVAECKIDDESFGMFFYLQYCCEHCGTYKNGNRCYEECSNCDCWCDNMEEERGDIMKLYSTFNEHVKPIKIKVTKEELHQIVVNRYRKVDTHPVGRKMKGR